MKYPLHPDDRLMSLPCALVVMVVELVVLNASPLCATVMVVLSFNMDKCLALKNLLTYLP